MITLILYLRTLVPGVFVSDFAEFQYQPARLGLPHPNGFPFYMLLGWIWSWLPVDSVAWRMNALSAVGGALTASVTAAFALRLSRRASVALLAAGLLALSPTLWYYSLAAERYTLNLALLAGALWAAWEAAQRQEARLAYLSALLIGLGMATHPSDLLLVPFWLAYLIWRLPGLRRRPLFWGLTALFLLTPLTLYLYVPWRWSAFSAWPLLPGIERSKAIYQGMVHVWYQPDMTTGLLWDYILGLSSYATGFLAGGWQIALAGASELSPLWMRDVPATVLVLAFIGALSLLRRDAALALAMLGFALLMALMTAYITQGKPEAYLLPATWVALFSAAFALDLALTAAGWLAGRLNRDRSGSQPASAFLARLDAGLTVAISLGLLVIVANRYPQLDHSRWTESQRAWEIILQQHDLPEGAGLLGHWSDMTPLWYMQQIDGRRPDLIGLFPPDPAQVIQPWLEAGGALYLAGPLNEYAPDLAEHYALMAWGKLVQILLPGQTAACPALSGRIEMPEAWPFAIRAWDIADTLGSHQPAALRFCWRARSELPANSFVRLSLRPADGRPALAIDGPLLPEWRPALPVAAGSEGLAVAPIRLPQGLLPGPYTIELLPYRLLADDRIETWPDVEPLNLGVVTVEPTRALLRRDLGNEKAPWLAPRAGPLRLHAWEVSSQPVRPGDPLRIDLLWEVQAPIADPLALAVGFRGLPGLALAAPPRMLPLLEPEDGLTPGLLARTSHIVPAPKRRGDQTYLLELRVQAREDWLTWRPTIRLPVGLLRVQDRPHLDEPPAGVTTAWATFGELAELAGYVMDPPAPGPGDSLSVTLYWRVRSETETAYTVFLHLLNGQGQIVAQHDGVPAGGELPTTIWLRNEVIADRHLLHLPADLPGGDYFLRLGLYDPLTGQRLPIESIMPQEQNALALAAWRIETR